MHFARHEKRDVKGAHNTIRLRHRLLIVLAALLVVAAMACRNENEKVNNGAAGTTDTSTTSTSGTDTSGTTTTSTAASASSTGGTVSNLSDQDKDFVMKAAQGGMAEVALGNMAASKATNADVKTFGSRMEMTWRRLSVGEVRLNAGLRVSRHAMAETRRLRVGAT